MKIYTFVSIALLSFSHAQVAEKAPELKENQVELVDLKHPVQPMLWKIQKDSIEKPSYLFGTIHIGDKRITKLHPEAEKAFNEADVFYAEVDLSMASQLKAAGMLMRKDGKTLTESIGPELTKKVNAELKVINPAFNVNAFNSLKTWGLTISLALLEEQLKGETAFDMQLWNRAEKSGKELRSLELLEEQLGQFDKLTEDEQIACLEDLVVQMKEYRENKKGIFDDLINNYLLGDQEALEEVLEEAMVSENLPEDLQQKFFNLLLSERNVKMAKGIDEMVNKDAGKTHFFAVGTAHYIGKDNVNEMLKEKGYTVTRILGEK